MQVFAAIQETCERFPSRTHVFVGATRRSSTFRESLTNARKVATALLARSPRQKFVPIISDFQPETFSGALGIWLSGKVVVPIGLNFADRDITTVLELSENGVVFVDKDVLPRIQHHLVSFKGLFVAFDYGTNPPTSPTNNLTTFAEFLSGADEYARAPEPDPDALAYILFSSGSTGRPKGIKQTFGNLLAHRDMLTRNRERSRPELFYPGLLLPTNIMALMSHGQTAGAAHTISTFLSGSTFQSMRGVSYPDILRFIEELRPDSFITVSSYLPLLLRAKTNFSGDTSSVKVWLTGGAPLAYEMAEQFEAVFKSKVLFAYGMTEAVMVIATEDGISPRRKGSSGMVLSGVECVIRNDDGQPLKVGEIGEVTYKSKAASIGYHDMPEETKATFKDGWVYTGDLGYLDQDNYVYLVDRKKRIIKVNGLVVYPSRVEEALMNLNVFTEVASFGIPDEETGEAVVVFYCADTPIEPNDILGKLEGTLRPYEVPRHFMQIQSLPKAGSLKIDFDQLRKLFRERDIVSK
jgi:long-chain acyl-CoA synthetase